MYETGHFATLWKKMADKLGLNAEFLGGDWRRGADAAAIEARLGQDKGHTIKAVCVVHNETSTGVTSDIAAVRRAIDRAGHPALLLVDTISSLASIDYRHDEWGVDVTVSGSQKGLMLPPGLSFNAISDKAIAASREAKLPKAYWGWDEILEANKNGFWPYTPATNLLYGLSEACDMLLEEGLQNVFARHQRHAAATREAVKAWGMEILCQNPAEYSGVLTAVVMPKDASGQYANADTFRKLVLENFNMSLGQGLTKLSGYVFRIGHLGDFNDLTLMGTLAGVEMGFEVAGVPYQKGGVLAAMQYLTATAPQGNRAETLAKAA
jgi:alanine-glyoxylate transaminase/serine-glyoxylate transaminase/serine-pyruvate transaminase